MYVSTKSSIRPVLDAIIMTQQTLSAVAGVLAFSVTCYELGKSASPYIEDAAKTVGNGAWRWASNGINSLFSSKPEPQATVTLVTPAEVQEEWAGTLIHF